MPKPADRGSVAPEIAQQWLARIEKGEAVSALAKAEGYDARTVKKHVDRARQGQEVREARQVLLRNALHEHNTELLAFVV